VSSIVVPLLWSVPWLAPIVALVRAAHSRSLDDEPLEVGKDTPLVSIIIPARNEERNIERCVRSVLMAQYPRFEVIVVDDHSVDRTSEIARHIAAQDERVRVVHAPDLPLGWFGKQWACATGAGAARGELLLFTDADTWHATDLLPRSVNALRARGADLLSVAGHQEMHSFWERVVQPQMFGLLSIRYGGTEAVSNTRHPENAIANGQFILVRRDTYDAMGGHALVRDRVAEDLSMAQEFVRAGRRIALVLGISQMSTHMYASLSELIGGWRKNVYAGGRQAAVGGAVGRALFPLVLLAAPLIGLAPLIALVFAVSGVLSTAWLIWSGVAIAAALVFWAAVYVSMRESPLWALLYPLGLMMALYIFSAAIVRGSRVEWKDRQYVSQ
jgi:chlorobactene glucosyltransferase